jgi:hypothetical protein
MPTKKKTPETLTAEPILDDEIEGAEPAKPADRVRAAKLRAKLRGGLVLNAIDAAWLADYESTRESRADVRASVGASRARRTTFTEEEQEAIGEGDAGAAAAAAGFMVREEGRRLDSLVSVGITALKEACEIQKGMVKLLLERNRDLESAHVSMMLASGKQYVRGVEAEAEITRMKVLAGHEEEEEKQDPISELAAQLFPLLMAKLGGDVPGPEASPEHNK